MKLLTKAIRRRLPMLRATEHVADPVAQVKFFTPWTNWTWYATEFDGVDTFFGLVQGFDEELGYFSLEALEQARGPGGLTVERDLSFKPRALSQVARQGRAA